jgi:hypothetical protein
MKPISKKFATRKKLSYEKLYQAKLATRSSSEEYDDEERRVVGTR